MTVFRRHLKKHRGMIVFCAVILIFQAAFALAVPYLAGELIGVGIQQKGIEAETPEVLSKKAMSIFEMVLPEEKYEVFSGFYESKDEEHLIFNGNDTKTAGEIYENGVMSGFYIALGVMDGKTDGFDSRTVESMMNLVTVDFLYSKLSRFDALTEDEKNEAYNEAQASPEALKNQLAGFALPYFYKDAGFSLEDTQKNYIIKVGALMVLFSALQILCFIFAGRISAKISAQTESDIRSELIVHTANFTKKDRRKLKADLYRTFSADISSIGSTTNFLLSAVLYAPFVTVGGGVLSFMLSPALSTVVFLTAFVTIAIVFIIYRITLPKYDILQRSYGFLMRFARSNIKQLYTIRTMQTRELEKNRFLAVADNVRKNERYVLKSIFTALSLVSLLSNIIVAVAVIVSGNSLLSSTLGIGDVIAFLQYSVLTVSAVTTLAAAVLFAPRVKGSFDNLDEIMSLEAVSKSEDEAINIGKADVVEYKNVSLEKGLENVSFTVKKGEITALAGPTGCGKTTLLSLLTCDAQKSAGDILFDGVPIEEISLASLRKCISFAHSEPVLFSKSIEDNFILYGTEDKKDMQEALEGAAVDFIEGMNQVLDNGGNRFSGGQKSRLALAFSLSKKADICIVDDCLRTVDADTEERILAYLKKLSKNSAVILVTQRINSLMKADKIVVFSKQGVEGEGTHSEQMEKSSFYRELALLQGAEL